jgi:hypothetical protein
MALLNTVVLSDTFDEWREKTNAAVNAVNNITNDTGDINVPSGGHLYLGNGTVNITGEANGTATISDLTSINVTVTLDSEAIMDRAQSMITGGIHSGISATYDDDGNRLNLSLVADPTISLTGPVTGSVEITNLATGTYGLATTITDNSITQAKLADDAVGSAELKDVVSLVIKNSIGVALKTIYGAGS